MTTIGERVEALRREMERAGVHAYLVPSSDAHQSEYVPDCWKRREWISGFTGSAGEVAVTTEAAGLWTDSRYFLQAEDELPGDVYTLFRQREPGVQNLDEWLVDVLAEGQAVGYDPRLLTAERRDRLDRKLGAHGLELRAVEENLVDRARGDDPPLPRGEAFALTEDFAGEPVASKLERVRRKMETSRARCLVVTTLDAIAWLYNVRGTDIDFNPLVVSYAAVTEDGAWWFVDPAKVTAGVRAGLDGVVELRPYEEFGSFLESTGSRGDRTWVEPDSTSAWVLDRLGDAPLVRALSPVHSLKAVKNEIELSGIERAMARDGVAMVRFLRWLAERVPEGEVTELSASDRLEAFRAEGEHFRGLSFDTISGYAAHGAIVHYRVTPESDVPLQPEGLYLVDSGAQYLDGTTDITRTVALGPTTDEQRDRFTRVLRGHVDLARVRFPRGATGAAIEMAARAPLWEAGLDYGHGTGHGVGHFLNVHEGPISISQRPSQVPLEPGMVTSNEPGYYKAGEYGIRIENLVKVVEDGNGSEKPFLRLETLTLCPIDRSLVDRGQLDAAQVAWIDGYHAQVRDTLAPLLPDDADRAWLEGATDPLAS